MSKFLSSIRSALSIAAVVAGVLVFTNTVAGFIIIPSESMQPTLNPGDYLLVNRLAYGVHVPFTSAVELSRWSLPARGDIVIFNSLPESEHDGALFIKRVVGLSGDTIEVQDDHIVLNGKRLQYGRSGSGPESEALGHVKHLVLTGPGPVANHGPTTVPSGQVFVMGDHRNDSADSRVWGPLPLERVRGRAVLRVFGPSGAFQILH